MALTPTNYNTNNPVPSNKAKDLDDNANFLDAIANDQEARVVVDRLGNSRDSLSKLESQYIMSTINGGVWAAGIEITARNQYMVYNGVPYKVKFSQSLPYTTVNADATLDDGVEPFSYSGAGGDLDLVFEDVEQMIAGINQLGSDADLEMLSSRAAKVSTKVHNTFTNKGGAEYEVIPVADYTRNLTKPYNGTHYIGADYLDATGEYVFQRVSKATAEDASFGVIGTADTALGIVDDFPALEAMFEYCRIGQALGGKLTGGTYPVFTPRSLWWVSGELNLIDWRTDLNFGNSEMRPLTTGFVPINYESAQSDFSGLQIWYDHLEEEAVYLAALPAIQFSKDQPVAVTSETPFNKMSRVWIYNAYHGVYLYSQDTSGGLIWQNRFDQCLTWNTLDYGFYFWSVAQVSTTTTFANTHAKNVTRAAVQHNGQVYRALQHMLSTDSPIEPGVTVGWEDYWVTNPSETPTTQPAWAPNTFYRTCGKGYFINNVQTVSFDNSSADGGVNFEEGNVIYALNSHVVVNSFHLEGTNLNFADRPPIIINSDMDWGWLYLYDIRVQMQNSTDRCALIGGNMGRQRAGKLSGIRNQAQNAYRVGQFSSLRLKSTAGQDFTRFDAGIGVPIEIVAVPGEPAINNAVGADTCRVFSSARKNNKTADLEFVLASTANYYKIYEAIIPDAGELEPTFQEFSDVVEISSNSGNDNVDTLGKYAKVQINSFVQSGVAPDKSQFDIKLVNGDGDYIYQTFDTTTRLLELWVKCKANGQSSIANIKARGMGYDVNTGKQRLLYEAVEEAVATVEAKEGFGAVASINADGFIEVIPLGTYTSGTFTIPNGKTANDIAALRVVAKTAQGVANTFEAAKEDLGTTNITWQVGASNGTNFAATRGMQGSQPTATTVSVLTNGTDWVVTRAFLKFN